MQTAVALSVILIAMCTKAALSIECYVGNHPHMATKACYGTSQTCLKAEPFYGRGDSYYGCPEEADESMCSGLSPRYYCSYCNMHLCNSGSSSGMSKLKGALAAARTAVAIYITAVLNKMVLKY